MIILSVDLEVTFYINKLYKEDTVMTNRTKVNYRKIWETHHKACILKGMHIHHIDGDSHNNSVDNLSICTPDEHWSIHKENGDIRCLNGKFVQGASAAGKKGGKAGIGWKHTEYSLRKLSDSLKDLYRRRGGSQLAGRAITAEHRINIGNGVRGEKNGMFNKTHSAETRRKIGETRRREGIVSRPAGWHHDEETKSIISKKKKDFFAAGGKNHTAKKWDLYDQNLNLLYASLYKCDIMEHYNLTDREYKTFLVYMRRNEYSKVYPKLNILIKEAKDD